MLPTWAYAKSPDGVYVNMFVGSSITLENAGGVEAIEMVQVTDYPWSGKVSIQVNPKTARRFSVRVRVPNRQVSRLYAAVPEVKGLTSITVNGSPVTPPIENGYAVITRSWKAGDKIELELPMKIQRVTGIDKIEATKGKVALRYGPLIYNIEQADQDISKALNSTSPLETDWRKDFLGGVVTIKGKFADGTPLLAIPNFVRLNREAGIPLPPGSTPVPGTARPAPRQPKSVVWMNEG